MRQADLDTFSRLVPKKKRKRFPFKDPRLVEHAGCCRKSGSTLCTSLWIWPSVNIYLKIYASTFTVSPVHKKRNNMFVLEVMFGHKARVKTPEQEHVFSASRGLYRDYPPNSQTDARQSVMCVWCVWWSGIASSGSDKPSKARRSSVMAVYLPLAVQVCVCLPQTLGLAKTGSIFQCLCVSIDIERNTHTHTVLS